MANYLTERKLENRIYNNTTFTAEEISAMKLLGYTINGWRQRNIALLQHPTDFEQVVLVGTTFDGLMTVISSGPKVAWATALDYIAHGKVYRSE